LAGLAGCFAPSAPVGALCGPVEATSRCPAGLQCVAHDGIETCEVPGTTVPDAGSEGDPDAGDGDREGDGVADSIDNCPDVANASQLNEDSDDFGDVCDPCPPFANNTDGDGDGVGDACDPNPTTAGDKLVVFEGFGAALPPTWTTSGTFNLSGGDGMLIAGDTSAAMLSMASPNGARVEVRAALVVDLITATGINLGSVNLIDRLQPNTDKSVACQLSGLSNGTQEELRIFDASTIAVIESAPHAFSTGTEKELALRRNGTSYSCRVTGPALQLTGAAAFSPAQPRIGVRVRGAAARFHWVMLVTSP
jgi:hypothetical protein